MKTKYTNAYLMPKVWDTVLEPLWSIHMDNTFWDAQCRALSPLDLKHYDRSDMLRDLMPHLPRHYFKLAEVRDEIGRMRFPCWEYSAAGNNQ